MYCVGPLLPLEDSKERAEDPDHTIEWLDTAVKEHGGNSVAYVS